MSSYLQKSCSSRVWVFDYIVHNRKFFDAACKFGRISPKVLSGLRRSRVCRDGHQERSCWTDYIAVKWQLKLENRIAFWNIVGEERTNRWHRYRCLFTISLFSTRFGYHYAHRQENRLYKTACNVSLDMLAAIVWSRDTSWAQCAQLVSCHVTSVGSFFSYEEVNLRSYYLAS